MNKLPSKEKFFSTSGINFGPFVTIKKMSVNNLYFNCIVTSQAWYLIQAWSGIHIVLPFSRDAHFHQHRGLIKGENTSKLGILWHAVVWSLWLMHNSNFGQDNFSMTELLDMIKICSCLWFESFIGSNFFSFLHCMIIVAYISS